MNPVQDSLQPWIAGYVHLQVDLWCLREKKGAILKVRVRDLTLMPVQCILEHVSLPGLPVGSLAVQSYDETQQQLQPSPAPAYGNARTFSHMSFCFQSKYMKFHLKQVFSVFSMHY